jgi:hypothetical protein
MHKSGRKESAGDAMSAFGCGFSHHQHYDHRRVVVAIALPLHSERLLG